MSPHTDLISIRFENVRGFYDATLPLDKQTRLMVGRNHAGKTSALLLLRWLINEAESQRLLDGEYLNDYEKNLLLPARSSKHRARRITLEVKIRDGRTARAYKCIDGVAKLRVGISVSGGTSGFIQLGEPTRSAGIESETKAAELLDLVQEEYAVLHIPAARDAQSVQFKGRFENLFKSKLADRALHPGKQAGSTTESRKLRNTTEALEKLARDLIEPVLDEIKGAVPSGMLAGSSLTFKENANQSVLDWVVAQLSLKLITGEHDNIGVYPEEVGAGLQSALDIAAASVILGEGKKNLIVAVEEPEAFLHPSLQRGLARRILSNDYGFKTFVSSHSPILVSEARYEDLILCSERTIRAPKEQDPRSNDIHTALLTGEGAELVFASSVLFVEGDGDKQFFDTIRRRLAPFDATGAVDNMYVVQVGGKQSFGPWIRLSNALNGGAATPSFRWLVVPDGDAVSDVQRAIRESGLAFPRESLDLLATSSRLLAEGEYAGWRNGLEKANGVFVKEKFPVRFLDGDLERAIFDKMSDKECQDLASQWDIEYCGKERFLKSMGSKTVDGRGGEKYKAPYMRKQAAEKIKHGELTPNVRAVLEAWLSGAGFQTKQASNLIQKI